MHAERHSVGSGCERELGRVFGVGEKDHGRDRFWNSAVATGQTPIELARRGFSDEVVDFVSRAVEAARPNEESAKVNVIFFRVDAILSEASRRAVTSVFGSIAAHIIVCGGESGEVSSCC